MIGRSIVLDGTLITQIGQIVDDIIRVNHNNQRHLRAIHNGTLITQIEQIIANIICVNHINQRYLRAIERSIIKS